MNEILETLENVMVDVITLDINENQELNRINTIQSIKNAVKTLKEMQDI